MGSALDLKDYHPSVLLHCWLGHLTCKIVSKMTYNVSSGTLNPIQYHTCLGSSASDMAASDDATELVACYRLVMRSIQLRDTVSKNAQNISHCTKIV